jgi:DNA-binding NarL/FixJ family response regulator
MTNRIVIASRYKKVNDELAKTIGMIRRCYDVTAVTSEEALYTALKEREAGILLVDAHFVKCASAYVVGLLNRQYRKMRIAVFELKERDSYYAGRFVLFGAESYLCKRYGSASYHREIALILDGEVSIPDYVQREADRSSMPPENFKFSRTQMMIFQLLGKHRGDYEAVAAELGSERTVRNNISMMYAKTGTRRIVELLIFAVNRGFIGEDWIKELSADCENGLPGGADTRPRFTPLFVRAV